MKRISLSNLDQSDVELLSNEELKNVLGGYSGVATQAFDPPTSPQPCDCNRTEDCTQTDPNRPQKCNADCSGGVGYGRCSWDGTSGK